MYKYRGFKIEWEPIEQVFYSPAVGWTKTLKYMVKEINLFIKKNNLKN